MHVVDEMLETWETYCNEPSSTIRATDFTYFFAEGPDESQLGQFLRVFPPAEGQQLLDRIGAFLADRRVPIAPVDDADLIAAARLHVAEFRRQTELLDEQELIAEFGADKDFRIVELDEFDEISRGVPSRDLEMLDILEEHVVDNTASDRQTRGLFEACYGVESSFYIQWYLAAPVIQLDLDMSPYYDLWRLGGDCLVTIEAVLVARRLV